MSRLESQYKSLAPSHATPREEVCSVAAGVPLPTPGITQCCAGVPQSASSGITQRCAVVQRTGVISHNSISIVHTGSFYGSHTLHIALANLSKMRKVNLLILKGCRQTKYTPSSHPLVSTRQSSCQDNQAVMYRSRKSVRPCYALCIVYIIFLKL